MTQSLGRKSNPIDVHVGERIKARRQLLKLSQDELAGAIGVTFQQVQKYETGWNRVSASRLVEIAKALRVRPDFFFDGIDLGEMVYDTDPMRDTESIKLVRLFNKLSDLEKVHLVGIMNALAFPHALNAAKQAAE